MSRTRNRLDTSLKSIPLLTLLAITAHPAAAEEMLLPEVDVKAPLLLIPSRTSIIEEDLLRQRSNTSDTATLLRDVPGLSLQGAGGVSSLPVIHGLADDRIRTKVDGMDLISSCANHMNPPLSYIDPTRVSNIRVYAGIAPVSAGGDSIAGTILVESAPTEFAKPGEGILHKGQIGTFYRSNNQARGVDISATTASENLSVGYNGSYAVANNYEAAKGFKPAGLAAASMQPGGNRGFLDSDEVGSSYFRSQNHALDFALRQENHLLGLKLGYQHIPEQGFPNQRMDMTDNRSQQVNLSYNGQFAWGNLQARAYHERTDHDMNFGNDKLYLYSSMMGMLPVAGMPMETEGRTTGLTLKGDISMSESDLLRIGAELQRYRLDDWWDPVANAANMMGPETFWNIRNGERDRTALFGEWETRWSSQWITQLGLRHESVRMDAGKVQGYSPANAMMMGYGNPDDPSTIPGSFNAADRSQTDHNIDFTLLARFTPDATQSYEAGYARKTRSPNLYERYTWSYNNAMVMNMNNWYGDGNGYVGNLRLDPEVAHTVSLSANWHDAAEEKWGFRATPYFTYVDDYIDAVDCSALGRCPTDMMGTPTVTRADGFKNLTLDNQRARIYGADISGNLTLVPSAAWGSLGVSGVLGYVRGKNRDSGENLYRQMPLNLKLALNHRYENWSSSLELKLVANKDNVQEVRKELETAGYGLVNFYTHYNWKQVRFDLGIENLLDKHYDDPMGGAYVGQGATMGTGVNHGTSVPGMGRSINTRLTLDF